jgi:hypothetical protein
MADLTDIQRAVLRMLAKSTRGYALSTVMARGFTFEMLQELVRAGFATAQRDAVGLSRTFAPEDSESSAAQLVLLEDPGPGEVWGRGRCKADDTQGAASQRRRQAGSMPAGPNFVLKLRGLARGVCAVGGVSWRYGCCRSHSVKSR